MASEGTEKKPRNWLRILAPLLGLILMVAAGAMAWAVSLPVAEFVASNIDNVPNPEQNPEIQAIVGVGVWLVILLLLFSVYAMAAPKPKQVASERELEREKQEKLRERERAKKRTKQMREKMRKANKE